MCNCPLYVLFFREVFSLYIGRMLKGFSCGCVAVSSQRNVLRITSQSRRYISTMQKYEMPSLCCRTLLEKHLIVLKPVPIQIALTSQNRKQFSQAVSNNDDLGKLLYVGQEGSKLRSKNWNTVL